MKTLPPSADNIQWASAVAEFGMLLRKSEFKGNADYIQLRRRPGFDSWSEDALEKEMAIHSSTLPWKIPWTEEPDRLQSMGSQRVGHD